MYRKSKKCIKNAYRILPSLLEEISYTESINVLKVANNKHKKMAVILHLYYVDSWPIFFKKIKSCLSYFEYDLFITMPEKNKPFVSNILKDFNDAKVILIPNRGRDVLPFIKIANILQKVGYVYILKLHSKKSTHREDGQKWLNDMLDVLLSNDRDIMYEVVDKLENIKTGIVGPAGVYYPLTVNFPANGEHMTDVLKKMYGKRNADLYLQVDRSKYGFFGGTMFWARIDSINSLLKFPIYKFEPEAGQIDGTFAHALERLFTIVPEIDGKNNYEISIDGVIDRPYESNNIPEWSQDHIK